MYYTVYIWSVRAIPTYRVYRLYDITSYDIIMIIEISIQYGYKPGKKHWRFRYLPARLLGMQCPFHCHPFVSFHDKERAGNLIATFAPCVSISWAGIR